MDSQDSATRVGKDDFAAAARRSAVAKMRIVLAVAASAAFALALRAAPASATTYTVNTLDDTNGNSDCSLRDAINAADGTPTSGSTCTTAGTGNDTIQFSVTGTIPLSSTLPEISDSQLTINGPGSPGITIDGAASSGCSFFCGVQVMHVALHASANLNNLTITNGLADDGGGIFNEGTLTVTNTAFSGNTTRFEGNAIANSGTLTVMNSMFVRNGPSLFECFAGGAISNSDGRLTVTNSIFSGNFCGTSPGDGGKGGAIFNEGRFAGGIAKITNSTFVDNVGIGSGGAIDNEGAMTVTNCTFSSNRSGIPRGVGGAIENEGTLTVTNGTFSGNVASFGGGTVNSGTLTVTSSTFSNNVALLGFNGGAGAIENEGLATSVKSTIIAGSTDLSGSPTANCSGTITDAGYNISDDNSCGFTATGAAHNGDNVDPGLSSDGLTNNGGPTLTIALAPGSPAIDAIPSVDCTDQSSPPKAITTDQRGFPRPDFGEDVCDIGAFETQETFAGQPGTSNCRGRSVSALSNMYGTLDAAASALGFPSVQALQNAIRAFCGG